MPIGTRLVEMEDKLKQKPVVLERVDPEPILVAAPQPEFVVIGVSRDLKREEYRVAPLN